MAIKLYDESITRPSTRPISFDYLSCIDLNYLVFILKIKIKMGRKGML